jgi:hypothetical protein
MFRFLPYFCGFVLASCGMSSSMGGMDHGATTTADTTDSNDTAATDGSSTDAGTTDTMADMAMADMAASTCKSTASVTSKIGTAKADFCSPTNLTAGKNVSVVVQVVDATSGMPLTGLDFTVTFVHTSMGASGDKIPSVTEVGQGMYQIDGLQPSGMPGDWTLTLKFGKDTLVFHVNVK